MQARRKGAISIFIRRKLKYLTWQFINNTSKAQVPHIGKMFLFLDGNASNLNIPLNG